MNEKQPDLAKECLADVIKTYENDICCGLNDVSDYNEVRIIFAELIIYMTRMYLDVRYCSRDACSCSPIWNMSYHFKRHQKLFKKHLHNNIYILLKDVSDHFIESTEQLSHKVAEAEKKQCD